MLNNRMWFSRTDFNSFLPFSLKRPIDRILCEPFWTNKCLWIFSCVASSNVKWNRKLRVSCCLPSPRARFITDGLAFVPMSIDRWYRSSLYQSPFSSSDLKNRKEWKFRTQITTTFDWSFYLFSIWSIWNPSRQRKGFLLYPSWWAPKVLENLAACHVGDQTKHLE